MSFEREAREGGRGDGTLTEAARFNFGRSSTHVGQDIGPVVVFFCI